MEYDPNDFYKLYNEFNKNKNSKVIYGSRFLNKKFTEIYFSFGKSIIRILGNKILTIFSNVINNQNLTDAHTCYKTFDSNIFKRIKLQEKGFSFCPEINTKVSNMKIDIKELPIKYISRSKEMGKKISFVDAFYAIRAILTYKYFN